LPNKKYSSADLEMPGLGQDSSSDDELKPVKRPLKEESPAPEDRDPMKRKHHSAKEDQHTDHNGSVPPKKVKHAVSDPVDSVKEEPESDNETDAKSIPDQPNAESVENTQADELIEDDPNAIDQEEPAPSSPFMIRRASLYLPISPIYQTYPLAGICAEHLSPLVLDYYPPFKGVILAYEHPFLSDKPEAEEPETRRPVLAKALDEYAASYVWVTADFLLFAPACEDQMEGYVNYQNESFLGLVCWNLFNARIARERLPPTWVWVGRQQRKNQGNRSRNTEEDDTGFYRDEVGRKVDGHLKFRVAEIELTADLQREKSLMRIEGTLLDVEDEAKLRERKAKPATHGNVE
jgi:DNA-directed RNA polymerase I subunit RPA43